MSETVEPKDLNLGSPEAPEPLLPVMACLISLAEINTAITECREQHGLSVTEDSTAFLEGELIDDNMVRLGMIHVASVEWGSAGCGYEEYHASIYTLSIPDRAQVVVVRWWDTTPRWWSYGESAAEIELVIESLEREVGRSCNRVVWQLSV